MFMNIVIDVVIGTVPCFIGCLALHKSVNRQYLQATSYLVVALAWVYCAITFLAVR